MRARRPFLVWERARTPASAPAQNRKTNVASFHFLIHPRRWGELVNGELKNPQRMSSTHFINDHFEHKQCFRTNLLISFVLEQNGELLHCAQLARVFVAVQ